MAVTLAALLSACGARYLREQANDDLRAGNYEASVRALEEGVKRYPNSSELRASLRVAREEASMRLLAAAQSERALRRFDRAEALVARVVVLDPGNDRALQIAEQLVRDRRLETKLDDARRLIEAKDLVAANAVLRQGLAESPRNADVLALLRQIELQQRRVASDSASRLREKRPVSVEVRDGNLRMVLEALSQQTGVNFIIDRDVRPDLSVTVFLNQRPLEDVLDFIMGTQQLSKKVVDDATIIVYPNTPEKAREYQDLTVRSFFLSHAEAKTAAAMLRSVLRVREPFVDDRLNMLLLRESPQIIELAERLIDVFDQSDAEVMLEIEILEIRSSRLTELGIRFPDSFSLTPLPAPGQTGLTLGGLQDLNRNRVGVGVSGLLVNLRRDVGDFTVLANPRIRARSREKARILVGDRLPVITTNAAPTAGFVSESVQYVDVGVRVEFEPVVSLDDDVTIKVNLEVSSLAREIRTATGSLVYQIGTRTASTTLRLTDGETQILGGLISNEDRTSSSRVPGLGDLPLAGRLFSSQRDDAQRTEIILAITPRILRNVQRPSAVMAEFYSGTELAARSRLPTASPTSSPAPAAPPPAAERAATTGASAGTAAGLSTARAAAAEVRLTMRAPQQVAVGGEVQFAVMVEATGLVRGMPIEVAFDPKAVAFIDLEAGAFLRQGGAEVTASQSLNETAGRLAINLIRAGPKGASGSGDALTLRFRALAPGKTEIKVLSANPVGPERVLSADVVGAVATIDVTSK